MSDGSVVPGRRGPLGVAGGGDHDGGIHGFDERVRVVEGADDDVAGQQQARGTVPDSRPRTRAAGCTRRGSDAGACSCLAWPSSWSRPIRGLHERDWYPQRSRTPSWTPRGRQNDGIVVSDAGSEAARVLRRSSGRRSPWPGHNSSCDRHLGGAACNRGDEEVERTKSAHSPADHHRRRIRRRAQGGRPHRSPAATGERSPGFEASLGSGHRAHQLDGRCSDCVLQVRKTAALTFAAPPSRTDNY